jgi:ribosome-binding factor A
LNQDIGTSARHDKASSHRQLRVGEELRHALSRILARGELRDPALADLNMTVTEVEVSPDLKNAIAYVVPLGGSGLEDAVGALNRAAGFFRSRIAQEVALRHAPRVVFAPDRSFDEARRVDDILQRPRVRRDLDGEAADDSILDGAGLDGAGLDGVAPVDSEDGHGA